MTREQNESGSRRMVFEHGRIGFVNLRATIDVSTCGVVKALETVCRCINGYVPDTLPKTVARLEKNQHVRWFDANGHSVEVWLE